MKLISKFHDYYDTAIVYGIDSNIIYIRKMQDYDEKSKIFDNVKDVIKEPTFFNKTTYKNIVIDNFIYIFFCGKVYPCIEIMIEDNRKGYSHNNITEYCYDLSYMEKILRKFKINIPSKRIRKIGRYGAPSYYNKNFNKEFFKNVFNDTLLNENEILDLHFTLDTPVFLLKKWMNGEGRLIINPQLKKYCFYRNMDAFAAFQEISMFISGVMGGKSPKMIEISDDDRIAKHGFDKYSFRKGKE